MPPPEEKSLLEYLEETDFGTELYVPKLEIEKEYQWLPDFVMLLQQHPHHAETRGAQLVPLQIPEGSLRGPSSDDSDAEGVSTHLVIDWPRRDQVAGWHQIRRRVRDAGYEKAILVIKSLPHPHTPDGELLFGFQGLTHLWVASVNGDLSEVYHEGSRYYCISVPISQERNSTDRKRKMVEDVASEKRSKPLKLFSVTEQDEVGSSAAPTKKYAHIISRHLPKRTREGEDNDDSPLASQDVDVASVMLMGTTEREMLPLQLDVIDDDEKMMRTTMLASPLSSAGALA